MRTRFTEKRRPVDPRVYGTTAEMNGLVIRGGVPQRHEPSGAYIAMTELDGWWGTTGSSGETTARTLAHGGWDNRAFWLPRYFTIVGIVWGDTDEQVEAGINAVAGAIPLDERRPFVLYRHGVPQYVMARLEGDPEFTWDGGEVAEFNIQLSATDYRKMSGTGRGETRVQHGPVQGLGARLEVRTDGTAPPTTELVVRGTITRPAIIDVSTGHEMWLPITMLANHTLTINLTTREVDLNGANRRSWRRGRWIEPANYMHLQLGGTGSGYNATMTAYTQAANL